MYPAWPLVRSYTTGVFGYSTRGQVETDLAELKKVRGDKAATLAAVPLADIARDPALLAFARAHIYRPEWLFLDEATAALDEPAEKHMYELVRRHLPRTTVVSIAHRPAVVAFHDRQISVDPAAQRVVSEEVRV